MLAARSFLALVVDSRARSGAGSQLQGNVTGNNDADFTISITNNPQP